MRDSYRATNDLFVIPADDARGARVEKLREESRIFSEPGSGTGFSL
jgi:hypothetical protein